MNSTQLEFRASGAGLSQADKILARLKETPGERVPEPELLALSGSHAVHARIGDLRRRGREEGFQIFNHTDHTVRPCRSVYWLEWIEQP